MGCVNYVKLPYGFTKNSDEMVPKYDVKFVTRLLTIEYRREKHTQCLLFKSSLKNY